MQQFCARLNPRLGALLLMLALIFAGLQSASAVTVFTQQVSDHPTLQHSQHAPNSNPSESCATSCEATAHYCCLYALCVSQALTLMQEKSSPRTQLLSFFSSRSITPSTPPPKRALC